MLWACKHFQPYLIGKHFTLRTDHRPLLCLNKIQGQAMDRIRAELTEYLPYTVEHMKGSIMPADGLSRLTKEMTTEVVSELMEEDKSHISLENMYNLQRECGYAKAMVCNLKYGLVPHNERFADFVRQWKDKCVLDEGLVCLRDKGGNKVYVPIRFRAVLIRLNHDHPLAGHKGFAKTYRSEEHTSELQSQR